MSSSESAYVVCRSSFITRMSTDNKAISILLLCISCYTATVQRAGACVDRLTVTLGNEVSTCDAVRNFTKCFLRETRLYTHSSGDDDLRDFESFLQTELAKKETTCEIDVAALVEELLEEDQQGLEHISSPPTGYQEATSLDECFDSLAAEATQGVRCGLLPPFIKCGIRVLNMDKLSVNSTGDYKAMELSLTEGLDQTDIDCDIDFPVLIEEVRRERAQENRSSSSDLTFHPVIVIVFIFTTLYVFH